MVEPRSFLFVTWEGGGNVPAVVGVARRLAARGHDVRVLAEPCMEPAITSAGARFLSFTRHFTRTSSSETLLDDFRAKSPLGALDNTFRSVMFGPAVIVADETAEALAGEKTDVVVADHLMPGSLVAAESAGVPRAVLWHTPEYLPGRGRPAAGPGFTPKPGPFGAARDRLFNSFLLKVVARHVDSYNDARVRHGLKALTGARGVLDEYHRADRRLIMTTRAFDFPIDPAPANVRYVGPMLDDPHWVEADLGGEAASDDRPLVVASMSSSFQDQGPVLHSIIQALGTLPVRGLVSTGPALAESWSLAPGDTPANVSVVTSVSHAAVLPRASAVITHAGHGTVMRALAAGAPLVCLPMGRDQDDNAAKVAFHGAGSRLRSSASPSAIADAVKRVIEDPNYRAAAASLGGKIRADAADDLAVRELEGLADARAPHHQPGAEQRVAGDAAAV